MIASDLVEYPAEAGALRSQVTIDLNAMQVAAAYLERSKTRGGKAALAELKVAIKCAEEILALAHEAGALRRSTAGVR